MKIKLPKNLIKLAKIFEKNKKELFVVGGYVRNAILNFYKTDIDICSSAKNDEIKKMLNGSCFKVKEQSKKLGTVKITSKNFVFEHTTLRAEEYLSGGYHSPQKVEFVNDVKLDSKRRDFTINAIYYAILSQKIYDFYGGIDDIKTKTIKAILTPEQIFTDDGLRILRMVRLSAELNFEIDDKSFCVAKKLVNNLNQISNSRKTAEFELILNSYNKYKIKDNKKSNLIGIKNLIELNALNKIFDLQDFKIDYNNLNIIKKVAVKNFFTALIFDLQNATNLKPSKIITSYEISQQKKDQVCLTLQAINWFITNEPTNFDISKYYLCLQEVLGLLYHINRSKFNKVLKAYKIFIKQKLPVNLKELKVNGNDLLSLGIEPKHIGKVLNNLFKMVLENKIENKKSNLLEKVKGENLWK